MMRRANWSVNSLTSTDSGGPRVFLLLEDDRQKKKLQLAVAFTTCFIICVLTLAGQLLPLYCSWHDLRIHIKTFSLKTSQGELPASLPELIRGQFGDGQLVGPLFLLLWSGLLPHIKQFVFIYALWKGTKEGESLPVRVPHIYGWLEALGRFAFFDQWVTAAHCGLAAVNRSLPGGLKINGIPVDFTFAFRLRPGNGLFMFFGAQVLAQVLGCAVTKHPTRMPDKNISVVSFLAPRLSMPRNQSLKRLRRSFTAELKDYARSKDWARLLDFAVLANVILFIVAISVPVISIHVHADISDRIAALSIQLHRPLKDGDYSIADIIRAVASEEREGIAVSCFCALLVIVIPFSRAVLLASAWLAPLSRERQMQCTKAASWCGLLASFDVFFLAVAITTFEVPHIFDQTDALFLSAKRNSGFMLVFLAAMLETCLAAIVVRVVTTARAIDIPGARLSGHGSSVWVVQLDQLAES
eukprot:TRINITY_DN58413_c0_g1_i1.p1 TRINITY_DN58413_c0_g1~~TRINITY_DN58413_c0_g1_i1.p1  ORF type:complete len:470 (+),score=77.25 TRINITY_DN58413_c0_g1_i1:194-1603(+)